MKKASEIPGPHESVNISYMNCKKKNKNHWVQDPNNNLRVCKKEKSCATSRRPRGNEKNGTTKKKPWLGKLVLVWLAGGG